MYNTKVTDRQITNIPHVKPESHISSVTKSGSSSGLGFIRISSPMTFPAAKNIVDAAIKRHNISLFSQDTIKKTINIPARAK